MSIQPPKIDNRNYDDIVNQTVELVKRFTAFVEPKPNALVGRILDENFIDNQGNTIGKSGDLITEELAKKIARGKGNELVKVKGWQGEPDAGMGLIRIFGRMAALVSDRLNQAPDKNFLAFLDLIGTQLLPPQPAKVPLTFSVVEGSPVDALVPAHTQVAAPPADEQEEEVVFETDRELVVTTAQLKAVFVREPEKDKYSDRTSQATTGKKDAAFEAFTAEQPIEHCLYLACDELFTLPGTKTVTLTINSPQALELAKFQISWSYWDGLAWKQLQPANLPSPPTNSQWQVQLHLPVPIKGKINGLEAGWLRARLDTSLSQNSLQLPYINSVSAKAKIESSGIAPDLCFFNTVPLDLSKDFYPFGEQTHFNDTLYIASQEVFARSGASITVKVQLSSPPPLPINPSPDLEIEWEVWNGQGWQSLKNSSFSDKTQAFSKAENVQFTLPPHITSTTVNGEKNYWLRARIIKGNYGTKASQATVITTLSENSKTDDKNKKTVLTVNSVRGFMPNDRIQIGSGGRNPEEKSIQSIDFEGKTLTLEGEITPPYPKGTSVMLLSDSTFGPPSVKSLSLSYTYEASSSLSACRAYNDFHYVDLLSTALTEEAISGQKILKLASVLGFAKGDRLWTDRTEEQEIEAIDLEQRTVTLQSGLAADRDAEKLVEFFTTLKAEAKTGETLLKLSSVKHFRVGDRLRIVTTNGSTTQECEIEAVNLDRQTVTIRSALTQDLAENTKVLQSFQPFKATADRYPAIYLGFDKPFANRHTSLFAQVEPPQSVQPNDTEPVRLVWEYASPSGWSWLGVQDETKAFAERGLIQFIGPTDWKKTSEFGQELFWLRVNWQEGQFRVPPRLQRLLTNTMWATQAITLENEILGSSDGTTSEIFRTVQKPVLQGEQLEVQEVKIPSAEERAAIELLEGNDAVKVVRDEAGQIEAVWVRWHKVRDFYGSKPRDRHYVLDRLTGEVQFGDGQYGMVPPQGRNNIRLSQYQTGGGTRGNLAANTVVQLKTTVPYIEKVTNLEAAGGGTEQESIDRVKERGPKFLRHRDRAVTIQDFEDLAYEASPDVARAKAIAPTFKQKSKDQKDNRFNPLDPNLWLDHKTPNLDNHNKAKADNAGQIRILIVPRTTAPQPVPSLGLIDRVKAYMRERCDPSVDLQVTGPEWQAVSVTAEVVPKSLEKADAVRAAVVQQLEKFLHPLTGGKKGQGWALGRLPQQSDLYAVIQSIPGVDHVRSLKVEPDPETKHLSPEQLIYSGTLIISSILPQEGA